MLADANRSGLALLFSLRHDFPTEWSAFVNSNPAGAVFTVRLRKDLFPYFVQSETLAIDALELFAAGGVGLSQRSVDVPANLAGDLNGPTHSSEIPLTLDADVLKQDAAQVYLIIRYSL